MPMIQHYTAENGAIIRFQDKRQNQHSKRCHPRDIVLVNVDDQDSLEAMNLREAICLDIRRGQGENEIGIAKGLLWK